MKTPLPPKHWPQLAACFFALAIPSLAGGQERPKTMVFQLDKPFTFHFGDTAQGPGGLSIWFSGAGLDNDGKNPSPDFSFKRAGRALDRPFWSQQTAVPGQPLMRGLLGENAITVLKVEPQKPYATTLLVSKYKPAALKWQTPITLKRHEFVVDPDGTMWTLGAPDGDEGAPLLRLRARPKNSLEQQSTDLQPGKKGTFGPHAWGDVLITAQIASGTVQRPGAVRLQISKPQATVKRLALGKPLTLHPGESGRESSGFTLTLEGYGHAIALNGHDRLTVHVALKQGSKEGSLIFLPSPKKKPLGLEKWEGWTITLQSCEEIGPPHSVTATSTFVVQKTR